MHVVFPLTVLYTTPTIAIALVFLMFGLRQALNMRMRYVHRSAAETLGILGLLAVLAPLGPILQGGGLAGNLEALKFAAFFAAFWVGYQVDVTEKRLNTSVYVMVIPIFAFYLVSSIIGLNGVAIQQASPVYPPDNNHSAVLFSFFGFFLIAGGHLSRKYLAIALFLVFAVLIRSRSLIAMTPFFYVFYADRLRLSTVLIFPAMFLIVAFLVINNISFDTFSDRLRLLIWSFSLDYALSNSVSLIGQGEAAFGAALAQFDFYRDLQVSHGHNLFLHSWASYGIVCLALLVALFVHLLYVCWRFGDAMLAFQLGTFLVFAQLETVISDTRIFCAILFFIGMRMKMQYMTSIRMRV